MRELIKSAARGLALFLVLPAVASYSIRAALMGPDRALEGSTQAMGWLPGLLGQYIRRAFLGQVLAGCEPSAVVEFGTIFSQAGARIGANAYIGPRCHLGLVHIERDVLIAAGVHVPSGRTTHSFDDLETPIREQERARHAVRIGKGSWIGCAAVVMADVGCETVVGAGAVVTKPLPDRVVAAGVPARILRARETVDHG